MPGPGAQLAQLSCTRAVLVAIAVFFTSIPGSLAAEWCTLASTLPYGGNLTQVYSCAPASPFLFLFPRIFTPVSVSVRCPTSWYSVYTANSEDALKEKFIFRETAWCGLEGLVDGNTCSLQVSPFEQVYVGVRSSRECAVTSHTSLSRLMPAGLAVGVLVFFLAPLLSRSLLFRLSCGTLAFTAGSLLVLLVLLFRLIPHKRTAAVAATAMGSTGLAVARWVTGQWLPSWYQLTNNRWFAGYVATSMVLGACVTYVYDDRRNPRVNTLIKVALRIAGLALVYFGTWTFYPLSAAIISLLLATIAGPGMVSGAQQAAVKVQQVAETTVTLVMTPFRALTPAFTPARSTHRARPSAMATPGTGFTAAAATPVNGIASAIAAAAATPATRPTPPTRGVGGLAALLTGGRALLSAPRSALLASAARQQLPPPEVEMEDVEMEDAEEAERRREEEADEEETLRVLWLRSGGPPTTGRRTPLHLKTPPPDPWSMVPRPAAALASAGKRILSFEEKMARNALRDAVGGSPNRVNPLLKAGMITNPITGRAIKIGGDVFNRLVEQGYHTDYSRGVMVAPGEVEAEVEGEGDAARTGGRSTGKRSARK